jgi:2,3-bisphosphoglycerate-independent phosphoglycerate mutase
MSNKKTVLVVLDGWGEGPKNDSNPIHSANLENMANLRNNFPLGFLQASGISVGLPWGEVGNSEVGHLNLGAGKIVYQYFPRVSMAIQDGSFFKNPALLKSLEHAKKNNSAVNLVGLLSKGSVHSSVEHLNALIKFAKEFGIQKLNVHLFTDGRDSPPNSAMELLSKLPEGALDNVASLSGRFYAMDRDNQWKRTEMVYNLLLGNGKVIAKENIETHLKETYVKNLNDEYIEPVLIGEKRPVQNNDSVIFFNFREDRMKQIVSAFISDEFNNFPRTKLDNLQITTLTPYDTDFGADVAFPPEKIETPLGKVLSDAGKTQFRITETQKYPHITYFFNGLREEPFKNEYRVLIPSKQSFRPAEHPEMMAPEITNRLIQSIDEGVFDFTLVNFPNPDMIAHTGDFNATVQAVKTIDEQIKKIADICLMKGVSLLITSDHGNAERLFNPQTGEIETQHDPNPVPFILVDKNYEKKKTEEEIAYIAKMPIGVLADVAPTVLELMGIPQPAEMTGKSLMHLLLQ